MDWFALIVCTTIAVAWSIVAFAKEKEECNAWIYKKISILMNEKIATQGITLLVTIIGVILGLMVTNATQELNDRKDTETVLVSLREECASIQNAIEQSYLSIIEISIKNKEPDEAIVKRFRNMPDMHIILETVFSNELVMTNVHAETYKAMSECYRECKSALYVISHTLNCDALISELNVLKENMEYMQGIIDIELSHQMKSENTVKRMIDEIKKPIKYEAEY